MNTPRASDATAASPPRNEVLTPSAHWSFSTAMAPLSAISGRSLSAAWPRTTITCSDGTARAVSIARRNSDEPRKRSNCFGLPPIRLEPPAARMTAASTYAEPTPALPARVASQAPACRSWPQSSAPG